MNDQYDVALVGGGTGGHITPLISVAKKLLQDNPKISLCYFAPENISSLDQLGIDNFSVTTEKLRRYFALNNLLLPFKVAKGIRQATDILKKHRPKIIFAKGGYAVLPVVYAAARLRIPVVAHESDIVPGLTTRRIIPKVEVLAVGFPKNRYFKKYQSKIVYTGIPLDEKFSNKSAFPKEKHLLVFGGSQGARLINQLIWDQLNNILKACTVTHIVGPGNVDFAKEAVSRILPEYKNKYEYLGYSENIAEEIAKAQLVVTRAGATSLFEIAASRRAAIVIPLSTAASDHQAKNAEYFESGGGVIVLNEKTIDSHNLSELIVRLLTDSKKLEIMGGKNQDHTLSNSTEIIAKLIATKAGIK